MTDSPNIKNFDKLYCKNTSGKTKEWHICVYKFETHSDIITTYGLENGKKVVSNITITKGKNIGKKNETSHFQQAVLDATSKWNKKKDIEKYYILNETGVNAATCSLEGLSLDNNEIQLPMLAQDYNKHKSKIVFPVAIQPKLDGYRCIYNGNINTITTRQGKDYIIIKESKELYNELMQIKNLILDGELYTKNLNFEDLGVLRKTKNLNDNDLKNLQLIEYHVYDIIDKKLTFKERNEILKNLFSSLKFLKIKYVETFIANNEDEIKSAHLKFLSEKYEGTMIRNISGLYKTKYRSTDLLKYKDFQDSEFKIVDFTFEKDTSSNDNNLIVWIIQVSENIECKVRPMGSKEERQELYKKCMENFKQFKNKNLWVKYFSFTEDGNLRFPTTKTNNYQSYIRNEIL